MAQVNVYIDGFNLYYGAVKGSPYKWLDLGALCYRMLPNDTIQSIEYFTAIVSARPYDLGMPVRQQIYLRALKDDTESQDRQRSFLDASLPNGAKR
jgi:hypothetical protein